MTGSEVYMSASVRRGLRLMAERYATNFPLCSTSDVSYADLIGQGERNRDDLEAAHRWVLAKTPAEPAPVVLADFPSKKHPTRGMIP